MQKKLIALAVAGLVSAPAFAQSNVQIYGIVDYALSYQSSHTVKGVNSRRALDSTGDWNKNGSRIGFRGVEDLGNGLKAVFVLESGFEGDIGRSSQGGRLFGRQAYGGLAGAFGTVAYGRLETPQYGLLKNVDPFGAGTAANVAALYQIDWRLDNTIAYISPDFQGFNVTAAYSFNALEQEFPKDQRPSLPGEVVGNNIKVWAISPMYKNGPLMIGLNYHQIKSEAAGAEKVKVWDIGGTYDFNFMKLALLYGQRKYDGTNWLADPETKYKTWLVGATFPIGEAGKLMASYVHQKESESGLKGNQWGIGYDHSLSKRTSLYTTFAKRGKDYGDLMAMQDTGISVAGTRSYYGGGYEKQFQVGVNHKF